jgi:Zn-dependent protease/CBS domain-containing protein
MKWSFRLLSVAGIDVRIHTTFFLLLAFYAIMGWQSSGASGAIFGVFFISVLFFCVLLHEFGHAFAARIFGIRTPDITLLPIGGVARLERMPKNPYEELVVALAGPAVNVVIAAGIFLFLGNSSGMSEFLRLDQPGGSFLTKIAGINILLVVFNMIPAFPMDGGRVLRALLAIRLPHHKATRIAARVGQGIAILFAVGGLFWGNFVLVLIAVFVFLGAQQELNVASLFAAVPAGARVSERMITGVLSLPGHITVEQAAGEMVRTMQPVFPVVDSSMRFVGLARREDILQAESGKALAVLAEPCPTISPETDLISAMDAMQAAKSGIAAVVNPAGQVLGLVSLGALMEPDRFRHP